MRKASFQFVGILLFYSLQLNGQGQTPYNVLFIMVDDLNDCIEGMAGHAQAISPYMNHFASTGLSFLNAYTNAPMCGPSRSSLFTGVYPHNSRNFFQAPWYNNEVLNNTRTLMEQFQEAGYQVMGTGKILHHNKKNFGRILKMQQTMVPPPLMEPSVCPIQMSQPPLQR